MKALTLSNFKYLIDNLFKNKPSLDKISESIDGDLLYDNQKISGGGIADWIPGKTYFIGDLVLNDNKIYKCGVSPQADLNVFNKNEWVAVSSATGGDVTSDLFDINSMPVGTIIPFASATIPDDCLICDGSAVLRSVYPDLFAVIGETWGAGDGSTTFSIPDLRELVPVGIGQNTTDPIASHDVFALGESKDDQMQTITGSMSGVATGRTSFSSSYYTGAFSDTVKLDDWGADGSNVRVVAKFDSSDSPGARTGDNTRTKQVGVNYIIKAKKQTYLIQENIIDPIVYVNKDQGIEDSPVGSVISYIGLTAPKHYLVMDGATYNIADYPYLADYFLKELGSYNYYGGDGVTTFAVPDARGEFLRGYDPEGVRDANGGPTRGIGKHQEGTRHQGTYYSETPRFGLYHNGAADYPSNNNIDKAITAATRYYSIINDSSGAASGQPYLYTSKPTNINVLYCIKYEPTYYLSYNYGGFEIKTLWAGKVLTGSGNLSDDITKYDFVMLETTWANAPSFTQMFEPSVVLGKSTLMSAHSDYRIWVTMSNTSFNVTDNNSTSSGYLHLTKIIGLRGKAAGQTSQSSLSKTIVQELPIENIDQNTIYLKPATTAGTDNIYTEYMYIDSKWEIIGSTSGGGTGTTDPYTEIEITSMINSIWE
jgi:microcystin-dependent protein